MIYTMDIDTAGKGVYPASAPLVTTIKVTKGLVYRVEIEFPPGAAGHHHVVIFDGGYQVWPSTPGQTFHGGWSIIGFDDTYLKLAAPFEFKAYSWNLDETYDHLIQVRIGMVSNEVFMARYLPTYAYDHFARVLEAQLKVQEEKALEPITAPFPWIKTEETEE